MTRGGFLLLLVLAAMNGAAFGALMYYKRRARQLVVDLECEKHLVRALRLRDTPRSEGES